MVEIYYEENGMYDNSNIRFKTSMIKSNLYDNTDAYIFFKGFITVPNAAFAGAAINNANKKVIFKNCTPFTDCITEMNNTQVDYAQKFDLVMPMHNLKEYSDVYSKTSRSLPQYYWDEPALNLNGEIIDFHINDNNSASFKIKQ